MTATYSALSEEEAEVFYLAMRDMKCEVFSGEYYGSLQMNHYIHLPNNQFGPVNQAIHLVRESDGKFTEVRLYTRQNPEKEGHDFYVVATSATRSYFEVPETVPFTSNLKSPLDSLLVTHAARNNTRWKFRDGVRAIGIGKALLCVIPILVGAMVYALSPYLPLPYLIAGSLIGLGIGPLAFLFGYSRSLHNMRREYLAIVIGRFRLEDTIRSGRAQLQVVKGDRL